MNLKTKNEQIEKKSNILYKTVLIMVAVASLSAISTSGVLELPIIGDQTIVYAARNVYPRRTVVLTVNYYDSVTGKQLANSVQTSNVWVRKLQFRGDDMIYKGPWQEVEKPTSIISPDFSSLGYEAPSDSVVDPVYRGKPDDDDVALVNLTRKKSWDVTYNHGTAIATATEPGKPGIPIRSAQAGGPVWPSGTSGDYLVKNVTRTINFVDSSGAKILPSIVQKVQLTRNANVDAVTGQFLNYSSYTTSVFSQVDSPKITGQGYTLPNPVTVEATQVSDATQETSINVVYNKSSVSINAKDSQLPVGPKTSWNAVDNFVNATDQDGQAVDFKDVKVAGTVDTTKAGAYKITYSYTDANGNEVSKTITVTVVSGSDGNKNNNNNNDQLSHLNSSGQKSINDKHNGTPKTMIKRTVDAVLPNTGSEKVTVSGIIAVVALSIVVGLVFIARRIRK